MYKRLHSPPFPSRPLNRFLSLALSVLVLLASSARAQTTIYALGTLTQDVASGGQLYPPGALAGTQGIVGYSPTNTTGIPNAPLVAISGVQAGQKLVGIDYRPLTGQLYALGYNTSLTAANAQLYMLDPKSGVATPVSAGPITLPLGDATESIGFNFDPVADLARVVSTNNANYRLNPTTGNVATPGNADGPLAYAAGDVHNGLDPRVGAVAYTNSYPGATTTTLLDADVINDNAAPFGILSTQAPPDNGTLNTQASIKINGLYGIPPESRVNIDIFWTGTANRGYLVLLNPVNTNPASSGFGYRSTDLYRLSLPSLPGSPNDPANTNPAGYATNKINIVPANPATPFEIFAIAAAPTPTITSLVPPSATVGTPGITLTINGTGFVNGTQVRYNGTTSTANRTTTYISATQVTAVLTAADLATVGAYPVTVTNPPFPAAAQASATFYVEPPCNAPTSLVAGSIASTSATVSFTGNGSSGYTVTTSPATTSQTLPGNATAVNLTGLTPGTSYTVTIVGNCNSATTGPASASAPATVAFSTANPNPQIAVNQGGTGIANGGTFTGFASTQQGSTSAPVAFTISNASTTDVLTLGAFTFSGPYALNGAAPASVAPGSTASFSVVFAPTATGANTGSVSIANNSQANNPYVINFSGQGTLQDLNVTTAQAVQGSYRNVTIIGPNGVANLTGPLNVSGTLAVQTGGALIQNCQTINGAGNFDLQAGGTLAVCDPAGITTGTTGAVQVTGTRSFSPLANYIYNGTVAQFTGNALPATVLAVGVQNAAGLTLSQALNLTQGLNLNLGNLNTGGQTFTLISNASGTAGVVNTGGVVVGTATVQRYIDPSLNAGRGYRHYSSPVASTTVADLTTSNFTPVVNPQYNTMGSSVTPFPTVFGFDESRITTSGNSPRTVDFDKGYFSPNSLGDALEVTRGYTVNIPGTETVDFVGTLNNGTLATPALTRGIQTESGYHLRGNPYPSPLDWNKVVGAGRAANLENALYVFKSSGQYAGSYTSYVNGQGTNSGTNVLPLGQGFFVRVAAGQSTGSITFANADRLTAPDNTPFQRGTADSRPQLTLALGTGTSRTQAVVYFEAGATAGFDRAFDARNLASPNGLLLATETVTAEPLSINGQPLLTGADVLLPLQLAASAAGAYTLAVDNLANLPTGYHAYLRDALTGTYTDLATTPSLSLNLTANAAAGRYALLFSTQPRVLATAPVALAQLASVYPNPAHGTATLLLPVALRGTTATAVAVVDNLGRTVLTRTLAAGSAETLELPLAGLAAGVYSVQARTAVGLVAKRLVVQ